jgi:hypothetical protein
MKTVTAVISGATVSTTATVNTGAVIVDTTALTVQNNELTIAVTGTTGATSPGAGKIIRVYYAFAPISYTGQGAPEIPNVLAPSASYIDLTLANAVTTVRVSTVVVKQAAPFLHVWYSSPALDATVTLTVQVLSS